MFDPSSLAGKLIWLRASDLGADGSSVTTWLDQSGTAHDGTASGTAPTVADNTTPMGGKSVRFAGAGYFTFGSVLTAGSSGEVWMVVKSDGTTGPSSWKFGTSGSQNHYSYSGAVYEDFGSSVRRSFTPTVPVTSWRIYRVGNDGTLWEASLDGLTQLTAASVPVLWAANVQLGASPGGAGFRGNIAEVIVRSQISTSQEQADLIDYFTKTHISTVTSSIVFGSYIETLGTSSTPPRSIYGAYAEVLNTPAATPRLLYGAYAEALSIPAETPKRIYGSYLEVLTSPDMTVPFIGWGSPL